MCPLSPTLFAFATVGLEALARDCQIGMKVDREVWKMDMYADDLTAFIGALDDIQKWIVALEEWREMKAATDKCAFWSSVS